MEAEVGSRTLHNPKTGETIVFSKTADETGRELFETSDSMTPDAASADVHADPPAATSGTAFGQRRRGSTLEAMALAPVATLLGYRSELKQYASTS